MTQIRITTPTELVIEDLPETGFARLQVEKALKYRDMKAVFAFKRHKNSLYLKETMGDDAYLEEYHRLKGLQDRTALQPGDTTLSGLAPRLADMLRCNVINEVSYPETKSVAFQNTPKNIPREYQVTAKDLLLEARHGAVELATGMGKSTIILQLARQVGLPTVIMCPSKSIAKQLYSDFLNAFGKAKVGMYGDSKKECTKLFTIAISASLVRVEEGSEHWDIFRQKPVFIVDESHLTPAATLQTVCFSLMANAPYRFFFSATQMRGDGLGIILEGITGKIVMRIPAREGIQAGWLARPNFRMVNVKAEDDYMSKDVLRLHRHHVVQSKTIPRLAGKLANLSVDHLKTPTLILVDEMPQFTKVLPHLRHETWFAHGGATVKKGEKNPLPEKYQKPDVDALVKDFNAGKFPILVGTSAVSTGTDFTRVGHIIYMMGGGSETPLRQAIGRGTRKPDGKQSFIFTDFDVVDIVPLHAQADARREVYADVWAPAEEIRGLT